VELGREDVTVRTGVLTARFLCGDGEFFHDFADRIRDELLPDPAAFAGHRHWFESIAPYVDLGEGTHVDRDELATRAGSVLRGCPSFSFDPAKPWHVGYGMNHRLDRPDSLANGQWFQPGKLSGPPIDWPLARISHSSQRILVGDHPTWQLISQPVAETWKFVSWEARHRGRSNYGFVDGHVEALDGASAWLACERPADYQP